MAKSSCGSSYPKGRFQYAVFFHNKPVIDFAHELTIDGGRLTDQVKVAQLEPYELKERTPGGRSIPRDQPLHRPQNRV